MELGAPHGRSIVLERDLVAADLFDGLLQGQAGGGGGFFYDLRRHVNATPCNYIMAKWQQVVNWQDAVPDARVTCATKSVERCSA